MEDWKKKKEDKKETLQCELRDLMEMVRRFVAANNDKVCFVGNFVAFDKNKKNGEFLDAKDGCNIMIGYGQIETLRTMLNDLRDTVEDEADEDGEVSF